MVIQARILFIANALFPYKLRARELNTQLEDGLDGLGELNDGFHSLRHLIEHAHYYGITGVLPFIHSESALAWSQPITIPDIEYL